MQGRGVVRAHRRAVSIHFLLLEHSSEAWREGLWQADMALGGGGAQGESEGESLGRRW